MPAHVLAPARSLGEPERARRAVGHHETRVAFQGRQGVSKWGAKRNLGGVVDHTEGGIRLPGPHALGESEEMRLVLASDDRIHAEAA